MKALNKAYSKKIDIEQGIQQGMEKAKAELVLRAYHNKLSIGLIAKIANIGDEMIINILRVHGKSI